MQVIIDNKPYEVQEGMTIEQACMQAGIRIPTLCNLKDVSSNASCGICVVEVKGAKSLLRSCITKVTDGMEITTNNARILRARKMNVELLLANHPLDCQTCERNQRCELQQITYEFGIDQRRLPRTRPKQLERDYSSLSLIRDPEKCILCGRCVAVCKEVQTVSAIDFAGRGQKSKISTFMDMGLGMVDCTNCGQCALVCPTGAIIEKSHVSQIWEAIHDPKKVVVVQTAPAIRVGIGEEMGMSMGSLVTGKMVAGLRRLGFSKVFDTNFTADLTIIEEGNELISRIQNNGTLPMITSCSPGWIKFIEHFFPKSLPHLSTCKSPQQMFGAIAKTYYAEQAGIDPRDMVVVSVMPCTAKKYEAKRPEMDGAFDYWKKKMKLTAEDRFFDVDYVLTTRELGRMFKEVGIDFKSLPTEDFDNPLGTSTGAAVIFGATGGVMEAALRTAYEILTGDTLKDVNLKAVRGMDGIREADININGTILKVAVAHTLKNARILLEQIENGTSPYAFIEVMSCPGGCLGGGGQPIPTNTEIRMKRAESIYEEDSHKFIRKSHENPEIKYLYDNFLKKPLGALSHDLLHTKYVERKM
ncbi:MAG: [FeFe] hydrogenase, group A [Bacteroidales bacterium]|jgi:iron-only hydrogenase group A|nr:[FeFe] hydrogenase, group A [Bacteroidales bacterium]